MDSEDIPLAGFARGGIRGAMANRARGRGRGARGRGRGRIPGPDVFGEQFSEASSPVVAGEGVAHSALAPELPPQENLLVDALRQLLQGFQQTSESDRTVKLFRSIRRVGAEEFKGTTDPFEAEDWFEGATRAIDLTRCTEADRLQCLLHLLKGDALVWWKNIERSQTNPAEITLQFFEERFRAQYVSEVYKDRKIHEFLALKQGETETVEEYRSRFQHLERYARSLVPTERDRCRRFMSGLHVRIKGKMASVRTHIFDEIIDTALQVEEVVAEEEEDEVEKKKTGKRQAPVDNHQQGPTKKSFSQSYQTAFRGDGQRAGSGTVSQASRTPFRPAGSFMGSKGGPTFSSGSSVQRQLCDLCDRYHAGTCRMGFRGCYHCGDEGHFKRECPQLTGEQQPQQQQKEVHSSYSNMVHGGDSRATGGRGGFTGGSGSTGRASVQQQPQMGQARVYMMTRQKTQATPEDDTV